MAYFRGPNLVTNGLVLCLDAANPKSYSGSGTTWNDLSGNGNNGTLVNGPTFSSTNMGALVFNGTNSYISLGTGSGTSFNSPNFSYGAWVYYNGIAQNGIILSRRNDSPFNQYNFGISNDAQNGGIGKKFTAFVNQDSGSPFGPINYDISSFTAGWYNVMLTISATSQIMYINGINVTSSSYNYTGGTFLIPNKPFYVGAINANNSPSAFFKGAINQVLLYNRTLSSTEVMQNYMATRGRYNI